MEKEYWFHCQDKDLVKYLKEKNSSRSSVLWYIFIIKSFLEGSSEKNYSDTEGFSDKKSPQNSEKEEATQDQLSSDEDSMSADIDNNSEEERVFLFFLILFSKNPFDAERKKACKKELFCEGKSSKVNNRKPSKPLKHRDRGDKTIVFLIKYNFLKLFL